MVGQHRQAFYLSTAAGAVGGIILLLLVLLTAVFCCFRYKKKKDVRHFLIAPHHILQFDTLRYVSNLWRLSLSLNCRKWECFLSVPTLTPLDRSLDH